MKYDLRTTPTVHDGIKLCERDSSACMVVYEPGNGTRYRLVMTRVGSFAFSNRARDVLGLGKGMGHVVAFPDSHYRTLTYSDGSYLAPHWLCERVGCTMADAVVLAELLAYLTDCQAQTCEEFQKEHE
jgi:hypothetical protein